MKIAIFVGRFPALSETFILNQITGLIDRGHDVEILANESGGEQKGHTDVEKYGLPRRTYYRAPMPSNLALRLVVGIGLALRMALRNPLVLLRSLNIFRYGWSAASLQLLYCAAGFLGRGKYDVIHCHFGNNALRAVHLREIGVLSGRMLTTFHGHDVNRYPLTHGANVYDRLFKACEAYTSNTSFTANQACGLGCPRDKITKLPVGVDLSAYPFQPRSPGPGEPVKILTVGRFVEKKGLDYAVRAIARVAQGSRPLQYTIVGDGELRPSIERLIDELDAGEFITLLGWKSRTEVQQLYQKSHLFVLPSVTARDGDREGQGLVLQEAQALGMPVVSTLHNGIPDGVLDGTSGFLVPERDVDALAQKIRELVEHPETWATMGRAGRALVEKSYDIQKLNDQLVETYQRMIDGEFD